MKLDLIGPQNKSLAVAINNQVTQNCYVIPTPRGINPYALVGTPGTTRKATISGQCRGLHVMNGTLYGVFGTTLYSISAAFTATSLGGIPGIGRVSMADNGTQLVIVNGVNGYIYNGSTLSIISDADFIAAYTVAYIDTYFVFTTATDQWFISAVGDPTSYSALDVANNEKGPDDTLAVVEDHGELFFFGEETTEVWFNSGNADFPFERNGSAQIERGTACRFSVVKDDNSIFFLGDDYIFYRMNGYTPSVISDEGINAEIQAILEAGDYAAIRDGFAYTYNDHGHKFYCFTIPGNSTYVFDVSTSSWHTRKHFSYSTHHAWAHAFCYGRNLIGGIAGNLYEYSHSVYADDGSIIERLRRSQVFSLENKRLRWKEVRFIMDAGNGLATGQGSDPKLMFRWSDDFGRTNTERMLSTGVMGDYGAIVATRSLGSSRARLIEIAQSDPVSFYIMDATASFG